ncbi:hypothetical protein PP707_03665 [Acetobacter pasteurianus]|nr:hypothetical protein [Acetobacter pasteurianus]
MLEATAGDYFGKSKKKKEKLPKLSKTGFLLPSTTTPFFFPQHPSTVSSSVVLEIATRTHFQLTDTIIK